MTYFVFIESKILSVPHMEPLISDTDADALSEARHLMGLHASAIGAHIFKGQERIGSIIPSDQSDARSLTLSKLPLSGDKHHA